MLHSTLRFQHSKLGMLLQEDQDGHLVNSEYDRQGRAYVSAAASAPIYKCNAMDWSRCIPCRLCGMKGYGRRNSLFNKAGQELSRLMPGNLLSEWTYDQAGRAASMTISRNGRLQRHWKYGWDANDRLVNIFEMLSNSSTRFRHDSMGNLLFAQYADNSIIHRSMDKYRQSL